jgi:hypothetical protein
MTKKPRSQRSMNGISMLRYVSKFVVSFIFSTIGWIQCSITMYINATLIVVAMHLSTKYQNLNLMVTNKVYVFVLGYSSSYTRVGTIKLSIKFRMVMLSG